MDNYDLHLDYYSLLNLHKALLEAKFHENPDNELVSGSPLVADIYAQVRELLIKSDKGDQWEDWFRLKNRPDYRNRALMLMRRCKHWDKSSSQEKEKIAASYLAPFLYSETELNEIIAERDKPEMSRKGIKDAEGKTYNY